MLVLILQNWDDLRDYIEKLGPMMEIAYKLEPRGIKVMAGRFGCNVKTSGTELGEIVSYLQNRNAREVTRGMDDRLFFE